MRLAIIDGDFILYTATCGNKVLDNEGNPIRENNKFVYTDKTQEEMQASCDFIMEDILEQTMVTKYIGFLGNSKSFRYDIDPSYKANRKDFCKPVHFKECKEYLINKWGFTLLNNNLEADDAVNIARNMLKSSFDCIVVSPDKDLVKCIEGTYFNPKTGEMIYTSREAARYEFYLSLLVGDTSDNIPGVKGCGKVGAAKILKNSDNYIKSVFDTYVAKYGNQAGKEYFKNYQLLKILDHSFELELPSIQEYKTKFEREIDAGEFSN